MTTRPATPTVVLPDIAIYHNHWTDHRSEEIAELFECMNYEQAAALKKGDSIWIDVEQPSGKVYGYYRAEILSATVRPEEVVLTYKGPSIQGGCSVPKKDVWHKTFHCTNDAKLIELIATNPLATETGTVGSISPQSRAYLESIGKVVGVA